MDFRSSNVGMYSNFVWLFFLFNWFTFIQALHPSEHDRSTVLLINWSNIGLLVVVVIWAVVVVVAAVVVWQGWPLHTFLFLEQKLRKCKKKKQINNSGISNWTHHEWQPSSSTISPSLNNRSTPSTLQGILHLVLGTQTSDVEFVYTWPKGQWSLAQPIRQKLYFTNRIKKKIIDRM